MVNYIYILIHMYICILITKEFNISMQRNIIYNILSFVYFIIEFYFIKQYYCILPLYM